MTRIMHRAGIGVTHGAGDGLSEFPSDMADAGTAGSAAALSVQPSDRSALVTLASSIRGSDAPALCMRVLVAVSVTAWAGASTAAAGTARRAPVPTFIVRKLTLLVIVPRRMPPEETETLGFNGLPYHNGPLQRARGEARRKPTKSPLR